MEQILEKWQSLLNQLKIRQSPYGSEFWSLEELNKFEDETGIIFPVGYKEYCQIFGSGGFGDFVGIYCPRLDFSKALLSSLKDEIVNFPEPEHEKMMSRQSLIAYRHVQQQMLMKWQASARRSSRKQSIYEDEQHSLQGQHGKTHGVC